MVDLGNKGFLSQGMDSIIRNIIEQHKDMFKLCEELNELMHSILSDIKFDQNNKQHLLTFCLLIRAMTTYQGIIILAQRGMPAEATVVLRTLLEILFRLCAIAKNENVADTYIQEDEIYRRKSAHKLIEIGRISKDTASTPDLSALLDEIKNNIAANEIKERSTEWYAKEAGLEGFYLSAYALCSRTVHVNVRDLDTALILDSEGEIIKYYYGPDVRGLNLYVLAAIESMIFILDSVRNLFGTSYSANIDSIYRKFKHIYHGT